MPTSEILARVQSSGRVSAEDALAARRIVYRDDGAIDPNEIEMLFRIDEAAKTADPSWSALIVEAGTDYIVNQKEPAGYIDEANANWLVSRISADGVVKTATELELLVKVLETAQSSPEPLVKFALRQVELAVVSGEGPLAYGEHLEPGRVTRAEAALVRRILYAFGGHAGIAITRSEAEVLFDINDASAGADNDPEWTDLFVKAAANCIMAASGYAAPPREVALAREQWLDSPNAGVGGFFSRMAAGGLKGILKAYTAPSEMDWAARNALQRSRIRAAEVITEGEAKWLADRMCRSGSLDENEKALLRFLGREAPEVHPSLKQLIAKAA
jgi:hypothetical protein